MTKLQTKTTTDSIAQVFQLGEITEQGQYVNRQNGQLLIIDEQVEKVLNIGGSLFSRFISTDPSLLEYVKVSENPHLPFDEARIKVASLSLPVCF